MFQEKEKKRDDFRRLSCDRLNRWPGADNAATAARWANRSHPATGPARPHAASHWPDPPTRRCCCSHRRHRSSLLESRVLSRAMKMPSFRKTFHCTRQGRRSPDRHGFTAQLRGGEGNGARMGTAKSDYSSESRFSSIPGLLRRRSGHRRRRGDSPSLRRCGRASRN